MNKYSSMKTIERANLTETQEDYLKQIFLIEEIRDAVPTQMLSERLGVTPASVTGMLKKLTELNLITHEPYRGVRLTEMGKKVALEIVRHHRLIELYLTEALGYSWDEVHEEAEKLEHVISENFEARIAEYLGHPTHDPHGDPIPSVDLELPPALDLVPLTEMESGDSGLVKRVRTQDKDELNLLTILKITLNSPIVVIEKEKNGMRVKINDERYLIPLSLAGHLLVAPKK
jgi:DtxR family Mn-dependent transcriptional regulator